MKAKLIFTLVCTSFVTSQAWAVNGAIVGNSGGALFQNGIGQLYDLYEAYHPELYGRKKPTLPPQLTVKETIEWGLSRMSVAYPGTTLRLRKMISTWEQQINIDNAPVPPTSFFSADIPPSFPDILSIPRIVFLWNEELPTYPDAFPQFIPKGATFATVAHWGDPFGKLFIQADRYQQLETLSRAALFIHEALYGLVRQTRPEYDQDPLLNSMQVRRFVGSVFSTDTCLVSIPTGETWDDACREPQAPKRLSK